jgi:hypothetical protein
MHCYALAPQPVVSGNIFGPLISWELCFFSFINGIESSYGLEVRIYIVVNLFHHKTSEEDIPFMKEPSKVNQWLWSVVGLLLLTISGIALYQSWPILFPKISQSAEVDPDCDLRAAPCTSLLQNGARVTFSIEPREIPVVKPLQLQVLLEGMTAEQVVVDFSGVDMNMGYNRVTLLPAGKGVFSHGGMLPVCVRDAMEWEAKVLISTHQGLISVPYRFITVRPGVPLPARK